MKLETLIRLAIYLALIFGGFAVIEKLSPTVSQYWIGFLSAMYLDFVYTLTLKNRDK